MAFRNCARLNAKKAWHAIFSGEVLRLRVEMEQNSGNEQAPILSIYGWIKLGFVFFCLWLLFYPCLGRVAKKCRACIATYTLRRIQHRAMLTMWRKSRSHIPTDDKTRSETKKQIEPQAVLWRSKNRFTHIKNKNIQNPKRKQTIRSKEVQCLNCNIVVLRLSFCYFFVRLKEAKTNLKKDAKNSNAL